MMRRLHIDCYYLVKPFIPRWLQVKFRQVLVRWTLRRCADVWPILESSGRKKDGWLGWPDNKQFAFVLTHDVESKNGLFKCLQLAELEECIGFRSCFNFVPEKYLIPLELRQELGRRGFEVGVHGLLHDGKDFWSEKVFRKRAVRINQYLKEWNSVGFRAPYMLRNLNWIRQLNIEYDMSTFDTDPFEPQPEGIQTIFPLLIDGDHNQQGYIELPYTLPLDSTLFLYLREKNIDIWKRKLDWIVVKGGMALLNVHPDYINFNNTTSREMLYPIHFYEQFLDYVKTRYKGQYWHALPREVARFCVRKEG